jgi:FkbM family methyltransferase
MKEILNKILRKFGAEVHGLGYLQSMQKTEFKSDAFSLQKEILHDKKIKTIFDAGANRGDVVAYYKDAFPEATIYAFEPFPDSFQILADRFSADKKVNCIQLAVTDKEGFLPFYVNNNVDTNSLLKSAKMGLSSDRQVENRSVINVMGTKLDEFCKQHDILEIDILKMDVQGGEFAVLKGAEDLLQGKRIKLLYLETYYLEQYENQPLFHDISKLLHGFGYYLQDIYHPIYGKGSIAWSDVIFLPRS